MTLELPLVQNELLRLSKQKAIYGRRVGVVTPVLAFLLIERIVDWQMGGVLFESREVLGQIMGAITNFLLVVIALFLPLSLTGPSVTKEKADRTLGLLILADHSGIGIVLSKFVVAILEIEVLLLSVTPIAAFAVFFGGVSIPALLLNVTLLSICAVVVTSLGIFFSTVCDRSNTATSLTMLAVLSWLAITFYIDFRYIRIQTNPLYFHLNLVFAARDFASPGRTLWAVTPGIALAALISVLAIVASILLIPRQVYGAADGRKRKTKGPRNARRLFGLMKPLTRLVASSTSTLGFRSSRWLVRRLSLLGLVVAAFFPVIGWVIVCAVLYQELTNSIARLRTDGVLDDFGLIPCEDRQLGRSFFFGHLKSASVYFWAMVIGFCAFLGYLVVQELYWGRNPNPLWENLRWIGVGLPIIAIHYIAILSLGCYWGTFRKHGQRIGGYIYVFSLLLGIIGPASILLYGSEKGYSWVRQFEELFLQVIIVSSSTVLILATVAFYIPLGGRLRRSIAS